MTDQTRADAFRAKQRIRIAQAPDVTITLTATHASTLYDVLCHLGDPDQDAPPYTPDCEPAAVRAVLKSLIAAGAEGQEYA